jgi:hypothetical protein
MNFFRKVGLLAVAIAALASVAAANASAAQFTASATGEMAGNSGSAQILRIGSAEGSCTKTIVTGTITAVTSTETEVTVNYSECKLGLVPTDITPATFVLNASGSLEIKNTITVTGTIPFAPCHWTIAPQTVGTVHYSGSTSEMLVGLNLSGIKYGFSGGGCNGPGTGASLLGEFVLRRVGGGFLRFDP